MLHKDTSKIEGYEYPRPSIERGESPAPKETPALKLSPEDVRLLTKAIERGNERDKK